MSFPESIEALPVEAVQPNAAVMLAQFLSRLGASLDDFPSEREPESAAVDLDLVPFGKA